MLSKQEAVVLLLLEQRARLQECTVACVEETAPCRTILVQQQQIGPHRYYSTVRRWYTALSSSAEKTSKGYNVTVYSWYRRQTKGGLSGIIFQH